MKTKKISQEEYSKLLINKQLELAGAVITYDDLVGPNKDDFKYWFQDWSLTIDQYLEFKKFYWDHFYDYHPKRHKQIDQYFSSFMLMYGLRYDFDYDILKMINNENE